MSDEIEPSPCYDCSGRSDLEAECFNGGPPLSNGLARIRCIGCGRAGRFMHGKPLAVREWNALQQSLAAKPAPAAEAVDHPKQSTFDTGAVRSKDADGVRYDLISTVGLRRLAETYAEGAGKYGVDNWRKGFRFSGLLNHLQKHVEQFKAGDTSEDHLAHAAWGLFTLMDLQENKPEMDDRYKREARP